MMSYVPTKNINEKLIRYINNSANFFLINHNKSGNRSEQNKAPAPLTLL